MFPFNRHNTLRKNLTAYGDGELSSREALAVERHLAVCKSCSAELGGLRLASAALKELPALDAPRSFALTPDMLGAPAPQPRPRVIPAYQTGMRLAAGGLAVALAVVVFADRSDFGGDGGSSNEAQLQEVDNRLSETLGATSDSAGAPPSAESASGYDRDQPENTGQAGVGEGGVGGIASGVTPTSVATPDPGDPLAAAADQDAKVTPGSLPDHDAISNDDDTTANQSLADIEATDSAQTGDEPEAASGNGDSGLLTIVEGVLAVLLAAALGGLVYTWVSHRRNPV